MDTFYFARYWYVLLSLIVFTEGKLKQCKPKDKYEECFWVGNCLDGGATGCPQHYEQMHQYHCLNAEYKPTFSKLYHCCKEFTGETDGRRRPTTPGKRWLNPDYLIPQDKRNAIKFPDIEEQDIPLPYTPPRNQSRNAAKTPWRWPGAQAAYQLDITFSDRDRAEVYKALDEYMTHTCFNFYPKFRHETSYIFIQGDDASDTGKNCGLSEICGPRGYGQFSKFGGRCRNAEWMIHELGHSLCFFHEQERNDRDTYIYFQRGCPQDYKQPLDNATTLDLPFDFKSIMMYGGCTPGDCIQRQPGQGYGRCGSKWDGTGRLTQLDIKKINRYYGCDCTIYSC